VNCAKISFPAIDITIEHWHSKDVNEVLLFDEFFHNKSNKAFDIYCKDHIIVYSKGFMFKIVEVEKLKSWQNYFPFFIKRKMYFHDCKDKKSLKELRSFVLKKIDEIDANEFKAEWRKNVLKTQTWNKLIMGK
jgi:hypothetical protein